jgi:hypothetical protein
MVKKSSAGRLAVQTQTLNILTLNLPHQRQPPGRPPRSRQPDPRPVIRFLVDRQTYEIHRHLRRPALDRRNPCRLEHCGSSASLKRSLPGYREHAAMGLAHREISESQSSAGSSVALGRAADPTTGPTGSELRLLGCLKKRSRRRLASGIRVHPLAQSGLLARPPSLAREEIRQGACSIERAAS